MPTPIVSTPIVPTPRGRRRASRAWARAALVALLAVGALLVAPAGRAGDAEAAKSWRDLNGRVAPDLVFAETALGLKAGTKLSSLRNKSVVVLAFWLRDCPHCKRELPKLQALHERSSQSGLQVISICHRFPLKEVTPSMAKHGWTFPVARDPTGALANRYGGGRRPGFYVIGIDGRVKASNSLSNRVIETELGRWRLAELGPVPAVLKKARDAVYGRDYGTALRAAEAVGRTPGVTADVRSAITRLTTIAGRKLQNRVDRAEAWHKQGKTAAARQEYRGILAAFKGTSLEARAKTLAQNFESRAGSSKKGD